MNKVSIIIPVYNGMPYLPETVSSVLQQDHADLELIIVDDGSTDNSYSWSQMIKDDRTRVLKNPGKGVSSARNHGASQSHGEFLAFLDADDVWLPENLSKKLKVFQKDPDAVMVHSDILNIDEKSESLGTIQQGMEGDLLNTLKFWEGCAVPGPSSILVKRSVFDKTGGFDERLSTAADQEFFTRVAREGKIAAVHEPLVKYRMHVNNMHRNIALMEKDHLRVVEINRENGIYQNEKEYRKALSVFQRIIGASYISHQRRFMKGFGLLAQSIWNDVSQVRWIWKKLRGK